MMHSAKEAQALKEGLIDSRRQGVPNVEGVK